MFKNYDHDCSLKRITVKKSFDELMDYDQIIFLIKSYVAVYSYIDKLSSAWKKMKCNNIKEIYNLIYEFLDNLIIDKINEIGFEKNDDFNQLYYE